MKFFLDASALLPIVMKNGRKLIADSAQTDLLTSDLAVYESCNGLWKMAVLTNYATLQAAQETISSISQILSRNLIRTVNFTMIDLPATLNFAAKDRLSFYDASYVTAAQATKSVLVTDDKKLFKIAGNYVKTMEVAKLENEFIH